MLTNTSSLCLSLSFLGYIPRKKQTTIGIIGILNGQKFLRYDFHPKFFYFVPFSYTVERCSPAILTPISWEVLGFLATLLHWV